MKPPLPGSEKPTYDFINSTSRRNPSIGILNFRLHVISSDSVQMIVKDWDISHCFKYIRFLTLRLDSNDINSIGSGVWRLINHTRNGCWNRDRASRNLKWFADICLLSLELFWTHNTITLSARCFCYDYVEMNRRFFFLTVFDWIRFACRSNQNTIETSLTRLNEFLHLRGDQLTSVSLFSELKWNK